MTTTMSRNDPVRNEMLVLETNFVTDINSRRVLQSIITDAFASGQFCINVQSGFATHPQARFTIEEVTIALPTGTKLLRVNEAEPYVEVVCEGPGWMMSLVIWRYRVTYTVLCNHHDTATALVDHLRVMLEVTETPEPTTCFGSWTNSDEFADRQVVDRVEWVNIRENYPLAIRPQLDAVAALEKKDVPNGSIFLWTGEPGSGKTWAIRSLMTSWEPWCQVDVICDGSDFLASAAYQTRVIRSSHSKQIRLIVLEDCDALIVKQENRSQQLSTLLNLSDGLVAQNNPIAFLLTSNLSVQRIDPAVLRPGRCLAEIYFGKFSAEEVVQRRPELLHAARAMSLAELYNLDSSTPKITTQNLETRFGFHQ